MIIKKIPAISHAPPYVLKIVNMYLTSRFLIKSRPTCFPMICRALCPSDNTGLQVGPAEICLHHLSLQSDQSSFIRIYHFGINNVNISDHSWQNPRNISNGAPGVEETRITVRAIAGYYQMGMIIDEIPATLPHLLPVRVYSALAYYFTLVS